MSTSALEIFSARNNINDNYKEFADIKYFDLHRKHFLYGRIDRDGDAVELLDTNLAQIEGGARTEFAVDFVKDAYDFLRNEISRLTKGSYIEPNSVYNPNSFQVYKAWRSGDLEYSYYRYLNNLYTDFVQNFLERERRFEYILNFDTFMQQFFKYISTIAYRFPITKTGYILSNHCSPFVSGLMIEIAKEQHGIVNDKRILDFTEDPNYTLIKRATKRVGFMVDRNAPWRFVFNLASGGTTKGGKFNTDMIKTYDGKKISQKLVGTGGAFFMSKYGVTFLKQRKDAPVGESHPLAGTSFSTHVFDQYYRKTHLHEIENIRNYMFLFYSSFFNQFTTFSKLEEYQCQTSLEFNTKLAIKYINRRELPGQDPRFAGTNVLIPDVFNKTYKDDFWLSFILRFRLLETKQNLSEARLQRIERDMMGIYRAIGRTAALNYINNLTKGFHDLKFVHEGDYHQGQPRSEYESRKRKSLMEIYESTDTELVATLNEIK
tara:strand:- start:1280 stop:2749 length:1470 start_codon:yes stop_codon:yes gene_type:complete